MFAGIVLYYADPAQTLTGEELHYLDREIYYLSFRDVTVSRNDVSVQLVISRTKLSDSLGFHACQKDC